MPLTSEQTKALRFQHIYLENWRNFVNVDVDLQRRMFFVGPNASGKSNFLGVFRFLQNVASVTGGFQNSVQQRGGVSALRALAARTHSDIKIKIAVGTDENPLLWQYEFHFNQDNLRRPLLRKEWIAKNGKVLVNRPDDQDNSDRERLTQTSLEQVNLNKEFRELVDFLASTHYLHIVPQLVREPDRSVGKRNDPYGGDFLELIASAPERTQKAWLHRIQEALSVAVPQLTEIELWRDPRNGTPHLRGKYSHWRPEGAWQNEDQFSDGTLRLLGLLWAILSGNGPLLLEEPELSLHPEVVRYLPQIFAKVQRRTGRQILVSTHSVDLLRDDGIGFDEVVILLPKKEGSEVKIVKHICEMEGLLKAGGVSLRDIVMSQTRPAGAEQLMLWDINGKNE